MSAVSRACTKLGDPILCSIRVMDVAEEALEEDESRRGCLPKATEEETPARALCGGREEARIPRMLGTGDALPLAPRPLVSIRSRTEELLEEDESRRGCFP